MKASTPLSTATIHDLLITGVYVLYNTTKEGAQRSMDCLSAGCAHFGLTISTEKTVVMHLPSPNMQHFTPPRITVDGYKLRIVDNFAHLGITLSSSTRINDEVAYRISNAGRDFGRPQNTVWNRHDLQLNTKLKMYKVVILTTLFYGGETWTVYSSRAARLNRFHFSCLHRIRKQR
nr:unnamed protein product [Spirometra erinaceieuropaei]